MVCNTDSGCPCDVEVTWTFDVMHQDSHKPEHLPSPLLLILVGRAAGGKQGSPSEAQTLYSTIPIRGMVCSVSRCIPNALHLIKMMWRHTQSSVVNSYYRDYTQTPPSPENFIYTRLEGQTTLSNHFVRISLSMSRRHDPCEPGRLFPPSDEK